MIRPCAIFLLILISSGPAFGEIQEEIQSLHVEAEQQYKTRDQDGHADQSIAVYKTILLLNSKNESALWKLSRSYRWQGDQLSSKPERLAAYKIAEDYAKRAIAINPKSVGGHLMLGIAYGRIGETQGVLKSLFLITPIKKEMALVLRFDPENDITRHVLAVLYRKIPGWMGGSVKKSINLFKEAIQKNPYRTSHYLELARSYLKQKNETEAIRSLETVLKIEHPADRVRAKSDRASATALLKNLGR